MKKNLLERLQQAVASNSYEELDNLIKRLSKIGGFTPAQKMIIADAHLLQSKGQRAIKLIGRELSFSELEISVPDVLGLQSYLAYILSLVGARYSSLRLMENVDRVAREKDIALTKYNPRYNLQRLHSYRIWSQFNRCLEICESELPKLDQNSWIGKRVLQEKSFALTGLRREKESIECADQLLSMINEDEEPFWAGRVHLNKAISYLGINELESAQNELDITARLYPLEEQQHRVGPYYQTLAQLDFLRGNMEEAKNSLEQCRSILEKEDDYIPGNILLMYFWNEQIELAKPSFTEKVALRCHPAYTPYKHLVGLPYRKQKARPFCLLWDEKYEDNGQECWLAQEGDISPQTYHQAMSSSLKKDLLYDLVSGIIFKEGQVDEILTEPQLRCLATVMQSGAIGVNRWTLLDRVYRDEIFHSTTGEDRLKKLISSMRKKGFEFKLDKNIYTITLSNTATYIIPMDLPTSRVNLFMKYCKFNFKREHVEEILSVTQSIAKSLVSKWLEMGYIEKLDDYKYCFLESSDFYL
jgi:tetratricopeptide (TPR) repeat protein